MAKDDSKRITKKIEYFRKKDNVQEKKGELKQWASLEDKPNDKDDKKKEKE